MNYEERYKEAIYLLKELRPKISDYYREKLDGLFPEIAESEDERTRKELMDFVIGNSIGNSEKCEKYLAWLEKQGLQNLANSAKTCKDEEDWSEEDELLHNQKE